VDGDQFEEMFGGRSSSPEKVSSLIVTLLVCEEMKDGGR